MKTIRGRDGDQLWFEDGEIERLVEAELRKASLMPTISSLVVDLDRFIERHLGASLDHYAQMDASILGVTVFTAGKPPAISINATLTGSALDEDESPPGVLGRFRATLAHEATHVMLHRHLFEFAAGNMSFFDRGEAAGNQQRCLKRDASFRRVTDWREFQANQGMAALLMPRPIFTPVARGQIDLMFPGKTEVPSASEARLAAALAPLFSVSKQAATIRLRTLGLVEGSQARLV